MIQFGIIEVLYFLGETTGKYRMSSITVSVSKSFHVCCTCSFKGRYSRIFIIVFIGKESGVITRKKICRRQSKF